MCGIAGAIDLEQRIDTAEIVRALCGALHHRGPDGSGFFEAPGICLGHRRLSIIDLEGGKQPLYSEDRSIVLVLNGEIYNYRELRENLQKKGHIFSSNSDSETLLHLYEESGSGAVEQLDGMFAFALYDSRKKRLLLARDRMGKKPLFYFQKGKRFAFASELGALKLHPQMPEEMNPEALADFFSLQYIPGPGTVYQGVFQLPPGHIAQWDLYSGKMELFPYWQPDFREKYEGVSEADLASELRKRMEKAVEKRLMSDVPFGVFLSGGIDSAIVAGLTAKLLGNAPCDAFTIGFDSPRYDERDSARIAVRAIQKFASGNLRSHERVVNPADLDVVAELVSHSGQPYADASMLPTACLCAFAREKITVALSGDGADELFGGYERYLAMTLAGQAAGIPRFLRTGTAALIRRLPDRGERSFTGRLRRMTDLLADDSQDAYFHLLDRCGMECRKKLFGPALADICSYDSAGVFRRVPVTAREWKERFSEIDWHCYLPGDILTKVDIASMANSLEVRSPFLDKDVTEFSAKLPWKYKLHGRCRKYLLKRAFGDLLPAELLKAPKRGFGVPVAQLLRGAWKLRAEELIFDGPAIQAGLIQPSGAGMFWKAHQEGKLDYSYLLWNIMVLNLWLQNERR